MFSALYLMHRPADIGKNVNWCCDPISPNLAKSPLTSPGGCARAETRGGSGSTTSPPFHAGHLAQQDVGRQVPQKAHLLGRQQIYLAPREFTGEFRVHEELPYGATHNVLNCWP